MTANRVSRGYSRASDPVAAVDELWTQLDQPDTALVLFFCSPSYDLAQIAERMRERFAGIRVVGCSTAGELAPIGYSENSITGVSFAAPDFVADVRVFSDCREVSVPNQHPEVSEALAELSRQAPHLGKGDIFAFLLIDGLCKQEEAIISSLCNALGDIPIFGASAGDALDFSRTVVYHDGRFHENVALLTLVATRCPFRVFKTEHFVDSETKMVVTEADPVNRVVTEINGDPAGREYARLVGLPDTDLSPMIFASHPVVVRVGGELYVRSIQKVNADESLTFFCAIDEGIVLTVARGVGLVSNLRRRFDGLREEIGDIQVTIGFDCILRRLELRQTRELDTVSAIIAENKVVGFNTYGEQFRSMHVNQTFTGVAIGYRRDG